MKDLLAAIRTALIVKPISKAGAVRGKGKGRRRKDTLDPTAGVPVIAAAKAEAEANWGLFEPLRGILEAISSIIGPIFTPQVIIGILVLLLAYNWLFSGRRGASVAFPKGREARMAAYEEIWRREESELWDWLEDRVGLENGVPIAQHGGDGGTGARQQVLRSNNAERKIRDEKMEQRQVDDALRVTEERLAALKDAVQRKKSSAAAGLGK